MAVLSTNRMQSCLWYLSRWADQLKIETCGFYSDCVLKSWFQIKPRKQSLCVAVSSELQMEKKPGYFTLTICTNPRPPPSFPSLSLWWGHVSRPASHDVTAAETRGAVCSCRPQHRSRRKKSTELTQTNALVLVDRLLTKDFEWICEKDGKRPKITLNGRILSHLSI